jgi:hypothetical protein
VLGTGPESPDRRIRIRPSASVTAGEWPSAENPRVTTPVAPEAAREAGLNRKVGAQAAGRPVIDAMWVVSGKITEHWGVATLLDLMQQVGVVPPLGDQR